MARRVTLGGLLLMLTAVSAAAQSPTPPPPDSPAASEAVHAHAFVSAGYTFNVNRPPSRTNGLRVFDFADDTLKLDVLELTLEKPVSRPRAFGFRIDFEAGWSIPRVTAAAGLFRDGSTGKAQNVDVQQAYVSYVAPVGSGLRFDAGKFVTPLGLEVIDGWDGYNDNASRSFLFGYAIPFTHTGLKLSYAFTPRISGAAMIVNGWDNVVDNNRGKSVAGQVTIAPNGAISIVVNAVTGPEQNADTSDRRTVLDIVSTWKVTAATTLGFNVDAGHEAHAALSGGAATWRGVAVYVRHTFTPRLACSVRGELFRDLDGARTGAAQQLGEFTVTPEFRFNAHALVRGDVRLDHSSQRVFDGRLGLKTVQPTVSVNVIVMR